jgi:integrase
MASINFRIKGITSPGNIRIRLKQGDRFDYEIATGLKVKLEHWSKAKQKVKNVVDATYKDRVNNSLNKLRTFIESEYFSEVAIGKGISQKWLKDKVNNFFDRPNSKGEVNNIYLISFAENFIEEVKNKINYRTGKAISEQTIDYYKITIGKLMDFEKSTGRKLKLIEVDLKFHNEFIKFLSEKQFLNPNTIGFYLSKVVMFCKGAERKGLKISPEFKDPDFYIPSNKSVDVYLNKEEIEDINNLSLPIEGKLDNARDWLIIGLWTGLRVSDLLNLSKHDIVDSSIQIVNQKTEIPVIIPLHKHVQKILKKRSGNFPRFISDQKFNSYIKEVCKLAGIDELVDGSKMVQQKLNGKKIFRKAFGKYPKHELVSSHICRRSFATNHYGEIDTLTIMKITGHTTERQFIKYIKVTPKEHANKLKEFWKKEH